jgi:nitroimidazol reductase NimA-like FMN-containing flavoprotein (pyridoxamine 5'-phosphate oxidase superfamily)
MPRQPVDMSAEEIAAFLSAKRRAIVGTRAPDGGPDGEPAALACAGGEVRFSVPRDGPTARNLRHDPRLVVSVEEFPSYAGIKGVTVHGRGVAVGDDGERASFRIAAPRVESFDFARMRR